MLQDKNGNTWHTIQTGSPFLSDPETHYASIEKEMLGATWAIKKCPKVLAGLPHFEFVTDHNQLLAILHNRRLDEIANPQLQRMKAKLVAYSIKERWQIGRLHQVNDALSRNPVRALLRTMTRQKRQSLYKLAALSQRVGLNVEQRSA